MIGQLYATHRGAAQCVLDAVPEPRIILIPDVLRYDGLARSLEGPGA